MTEIVVVMVLLGLITLLATSITLIVNQSQKISQLDSKSESEVLKLETAFKNWLMLYDSEIYEIEISQTDSQSRIEIKDGGTGPAIYMEFNSQDDTLTYTENVGDNYYEDEASKTTITFSAINNITFDICDGIIRCTASFENTDYTHIILYYVRTATILNGRI